MKRLAGTQLATTPNEAIQILAKRGIAVRSIRAVNLRSSTAVAPQARPDPPAVLPVAPLRPLRGSLNLPRRPWSSKRHYLLFHQVGASIRAGVTMTQTLRTASNTLAHERWENAMLARWADQTEAGKPLHECMAECVPPLARGSVGMIRVGEVSGFVPEAMAKLAEHHHANIKFDRVFWIFRFLLYYGTMSIPVAIAGMKGFNDAYAAYEASGGAYSSPAQLVWSKIGANLVWPFGPIILGWWLLLFFGARMLMLPTFERFRHAFSYWHPYMRGRARIEGISYFTWALGRLSQAGISPYSAWNMAAEAIPNAIVREKILDIGRQSREQSKMSDLVAQSGLFPAEYLSVIQNGEYTGTLPDALDYLNNVSGDEFSRRTAQAGVTWLISTALVGTIIALSIVVVMAYFWYKVFYDQVLSGLDATILLPKIT